MTTEKIANSSRELDDIGSYCDNRLSRVRTARDVLGRKRGSAYTVSPASSVYDALALMSRHNIGALIVVEGRSVVGVVSERDYARKVILIGKTSRDTVIREIMSSPAQTVTPQSTVAECLAFMTDKHVRHLPVIEEGALVGVLSIGDLVKFVIEAQEWRIEQYERYVKGTYPS